MLAHFIRSTTERILFITTLMGNVLTGMVGKVLDIYTAILSARLLAFHPVANGPFADTKLSCNLVVAVFQFPHLHDKIILIRRKPGFGHPSLLLFRFTFLRGKDAIFKAFLILPN